MNKLTISHKVLNNIIQESNLVSYKSAFKKKINVTKPITDLLIESDLLLKNLCVVSAARHNPTSYESYLTIYIN